VRKKQRLELICVYQTCQSCFITWERVHRILRKPYPSPSTKWLENCPKCMVSLPHRTGRWGLPKIPAVNRKADVELWTLTYYDVRELPSGVAEEFLYSWE
jgi:hypothetical protein